MLSDDDHCVVIVGGLFDQPSDDELPSKPVSTVSAWHTGAVEWEAQQPLATGRYCHATLSLQSGELLVVGGLAAAAEGPGLVGLTSVERRRRDGNWVGCAPLPHRLAEATATLLVDGKVLVCGGYDEDSTAFAMVYDPDEDRWQQIDSMAFARAGHRAARLADGRVLIVGGSQDWDGAPVDAAELWDPETQAWTTIEGPRCLRLGHSLTPLLDGRLLVTGGSGVAAVDAVEIWSPAH